MSENEAVETTIRLEALRLAVKGVDNEAPIDNILFIAQRYYKFLKGENDE